MSREYAKIVQNVTQSYHKSTTKITKTTKTNASKDPIMPSSFYLITT